MKTNRWLVIVSALLWATGVYAAEPKSDVSAASDQVGQFEGVRLSFLSDHNAIVPGQTFQVGFFVQHKEGFHTYWKAPGIVGFPLHITWEKPAGVEVGALVWAVPEKVLMSIHPAHGFHRDVLHVATVTVPKNFKRDALVLKADASWLACSDGCYHDTKLFSLSVPVGSKAVKSDKHGLFEQFARQCPKTSGSWDASVEESKGSIRIVLRPKGDPAHRPKEVYLFSEDGQISSTPEQEVTMASDGSIHFEVKPSEFRPKDQPSLPCIVYSSNGWGGETANYFRINPRF